MDPRITKIARILLQHSTRVKRGDVVQINADIEARSLILELYKQALLLGAYPFLRIGFESLAYTYFRWASTAQLKHLPTIALHDTKASDVIINIVAPKNRYELANIPPKRIALRERTLRPVSEAVQKRRWVNFYYPVSAYAQDAGMSLQEYTDFVFSSCMLNWKKEAQKMRRLKRVIDRGKKVKIVAPGTDLSFNIAGRVAVIGDGTYNMPDGEVYTSPRVNSVNGVITFTFPVVIMARPVTDIKLEFKRGRLVKVSASKNLNVLKALLHTDKGASKIGEFGIGCNYRIKRYTKNILFDEKIGGTVHLALGRAYEECKGRNRSAIHLDIIKDMRARGKVYIDDKLIQKNGHFTI